MVSSVCKGEADTPDPLSVLIFAGCQLELGEKLADRILREMASGRAVISSIAALERVGGRIALAMKAMPHLGEDGETQ